MPEIDLTPLHFGDTKNERIRRALLIEDRLSALVQHIGELIAKLDAGQKPTPEDVELVRLWVRHSKRLVPERRSVAPPSRHRL